MLPNLTAKIRIFNPKMAKLEEKGSVGTDNCVLHFLSSTGCGAIYDYK